MFAGGVTLGVYLLHDSTITRPIIWYVLLKVDTVQYSSVFFPFYALLSIFGVFIFCSIVDLMRMYYIEPIMIRFYHFAKNYVSKLMDRI